MKDYKDLKRFAEAQGFYVTSTNGGRHNRNSKHYLGLAIDVRTRDKKNEEVELFMKKARLLGIIVYDERKRPSRQIVWGGPHLHLEIGSETLNTVKDFQKTNGLVVDGIVGKNTLCVLNCLTS